MSNGGIPTNFIELSVAAAIAAYAASERENLLTLGSFSFHTGHGGRKHGDWVGMLARVVIDKSRTTEAAFRLVRHNESNETYFCDPAKEAVALEEITSRSTPLGTKLEIAGDEVTIAL